MLTGLIRMCPKSIEKPIKKLSGSIPYEKMLGAAFRKTYDFLQKSQWWTREQHEEYQMGELARLLAHAYENVPYYRRVFDDRALKPSDIQNFHDLKQLPFLTKDIIRNNTGRMIAGNYNPRQYRFVSTGGTTGIPMEIAEERLYASAREWAFVASLWKTINYDISKWNRSVILRGLIPDKGCFEYRGLQLILSSYLMTEDNMGSYLDRIQDFNPDFIQAYPSTIGLLADFILRNGRSPHLPRLKAVICASETISGFQRSTIEAAFKKRVYSFYGHTEKSCLAGECEYSNSYHIVSEYGFTEILGDDACDIAGEGEKGEIVCTGFNNYVMPLIRYRTGDVAVNTNKKCICGRSYKLIKKVQGRMQEYFVDKNGSPVTFTCSDDVLWPVKNSIAAYQYIQYEPGKVVLCIQFLYEPLAEDIHRVSEEFAKWYPNLKMTLKAVENIERTANGKFRYLIQNLPVNHTAIP